jgi:hypothetical protein
VIEAASERLEVKTALFAQLAAICAPSTLLTSNTSSISITAIAAGVKNPERVAGLHFFNPAPVMKLVEVVSGLATSAEVVEQLCQCVSGWGNSRFAAAQRPVLSLTAWRVRSMLKPGGRWKSRWPPRRLSMPLCVTAAVSRWDRWR